MTWDEFKARLAALNLLQTEFARIACIDDWGVSRWRKTKKGVPPWVTSWLDLYEAAHQDDGVAGASVRDMATSQDAANKTATALVETVAAAPAVKAIDVVDAHYKNTVPIAILDSPLLSRDTSSSAPTAPSSSSPPVPPAPDPLPPSESPPAPRSPIEHDPERRDDGRPTTLQQESAPLSEPAPAASTERAEDQTRHSDGVSRLEFLDGERTTTPVSE